MTEQQQLEATQPKLTKGYFIGLKFLLFIVFISAVAALYLSWLAQFKVTNEAQMLNQRVDQVKLDSKKIQQQLLVQKQKLDDARTDLAILLKQGSNTGLYWHLHEVRYLTQLADYNLQYERSPMVAEALLKTADAKLQMLADASVSNLRQLVADKISDIHVVSNFDLQGLLNQLSSISYQFEKIPLGLVQVAKTEPVKQLVDSNDWTSSIKNSLEILKKIVIVRHHEERVKPIITEQERRYIVEDLLFLINRAQWAAIHAQPKLYVTSLNQAKSLLERNYFIKSEKIGWLTEDLEKLSKINVKPPVPDMLPILSAIDKAILAHRSV